MSSKGWAYFWWISSSSSKLLDLVFSTNFVRVLIDALYFSLSVSQGGKAKWCPSRLYRNVACAVQKVRSVGNYGCCCCILYPFYLCFGSSLSMICMRFSILRVWVAEIMVKKKHQIVNFSNLYIKVYMRHISSMYHFM
jgi:hypothetical protein